MPILSFKVQADWERVQRLREEIQKLKAEMKGVDAIYSSRQFDALNLKLSQANKEYRDLVDSAAQAGAKIESSANSFKKAIGAIGGVTVLKSLISHMVSVRGEFQKADVAIKTMLGSADKAEDLLSKVREYAKISPLEFGDITSATQMMLGFNIEAEKVPGFIKAIGDVSMGESSRFNSLTLAFSQMSATGKLMGQDLNQMINAGFNPLQVMSEKTGKSIAQLKEEMSKGAISAEMVQQAFIDATSAGGKFFGMSENAAKTINGQISMMNDAMDAMFNELGSKSEEAIISSLSAVTMMIENYGTIAKALAGLVTTYGVYRTAVVLAMEAEKGYTIAQTVQIGVMELLTKAQRVLNATMLANPYVFAATAVTSLVAVMVAMKSEQERVNEAYDEYSKKKADVIRKEKEHKARIEELARVAGDESLSTDTRRMALVELEQKYPAIFAKYDTEAEKLKHIRDLKAEIAALDGKGSITKASNELSSVDNQVKDIENALKARQAGNKGKYKDNFVGTNTQTLYDQLKALQRRRGELTNQIKKEEGNAYLTNLTGISNADLEKQIAERRNLIAQMDVNNKKYGRVNKGGATGVYTKDELQGQLQILQSEQTRRKKVLEDSTKDFVAEANKAYKKEQDALRKLESLTDPKKRSASKQVIDGKKVSEMSGDEFLAAVEKQQKAVSEAKKKVDAYTVKGDAKAGADAASRRQKQFELEQKDAERQAKQKRALGEALEDAEIAGTINDTEREIKEQEIQHKRKLRQIQDQADEWKKEAYKAAEERFNATNTDKSKTFADTEEGKAGWQGQKLTDEQKTIIEAQVNAENAIRSRAVQERYKQEAQALRDYLKEYGTFEEKKLAITQEYEQRIADEQDPSKKAGLMMQRDRDLENLTSEQAKQQINWDDIFTDLRGHTTDYLEGLREQLQGLISSGTLKLDELEVAQGKIRDINALISEQSGFFSMLGPMQIEYNRRLQEEADAKDRLKQAQNKESSLAAQSAMNKALLQDFLTKNGQTVKDVSIDMKNPFKEGSKEWKQFNDLIAKLRYSEGQLAKARENTVKATQNAKKAEDGTKTTAKDRWEKFLDSKAVQTSMANLSSAPELLKNIGLGDAGEKAQKGLDGMNDAMGAVTDYMSGNYIGALSKGVSAITNFGEAFGLWSNSNRAEVEAANEKLQIATDVNTEAINRLTDAMKSQSPMEAVKSWEQAQKMMELNEKNRQQTMANNAGMYDGGHSLWYDFNDEYGDRFIRELYRLVGKQSWDGSYDIGSAVHDFSGEDWNKLLREFPEKMTQLGQMIADVEDEGNYNGMFQDILDLAKEYSKEAYEELKNTLNESITGVSFDSFKDKFKSSLMDMKKDVESFSDDFTEMLMQSVLDAKIEDLYGKEMSDLYDQWVNALSDNNLTDIEVKKLQEQQNDLVQRMMATRDALAEMTGYSESSGREDQTATASMAEKATYDQFDTYLGIATAQQIALEQIRDALGGMTGEGFTLVNMTLEQMIAIGTSVRDIATENQDIFAQSLIELQEANEHLGKIEKSVDRIETSVSKTEHLINDRL